MKLEITEDHPSGLKKGQIVEQTTYIGNRLIEQGIAKEIKSTASKTTTTKKTKSKK